MLWPLTKATAKSCARMSMLARKTSQLGISGARLVMRFPAAPFPYAQYPEHATVKNVEVTTE